MFKHLYAQNKPFFYLYLVLLISLLTGCAQQKTPLENNLQRPAQWATLINADMNLFQIDQTLYRSQQPTMDDLEQIKALDIKTIISLRGFHSDDDIIKNEEIILVRIPIHTWDIRDEDIIKTLQAIQTAKQQGPVLIHCMHGADRTGLISAMYRIIYQGWNKEEALQEMTDGGFGFHSMWRNIPSYLKNVNIEHIKKELPSRP